MDKIKEQEYRKVFEDQVKEKILGPGYAKDIFVCSEDASDEVLDNIPTDLYCTGVMTPVDSSADVEEKEPDEDHYEDTDTQENADNESDDDSIIGDDHKDEQNDRTFYESDHIGIITCIPLNLPRVQIDVAYAKYEQVDTSKIKLKAGIYYDQLKKIINQNDNEDKVSNALKEKGLNDSFSTYFSLDDDNKTVTLKEALANCKLSSKVRKADKEEGPAQELLKKLLTGKFYKRQPKVMSMQRDMLNTDNSNFSITLNEDIKCLIRTFESKGKKYLKVIIQNQLKRSEDNKAFYKICLFQTVLKLTPIDGVLTSYTEPIISLDDTENNINELVYREVSNYGKGIGCAVNWAEDGSWIETTYMPRCEVRKFSNEIKKEEVIDENRREAINEACTLRNISIWSDWDDDKIISQLSEFTSGYALWHQKQKENDIVEANHEDAVKEILEKQEQLLGRLKDNVDFMSKNEEALECFKIANTAMLIQMVVSRDSHFAKNRIEVGEDANIFNSIDYFKDHKYLEGLKDGKEPAYRPFQLAFLLMNVKSTMVEDDPYRNKYVDLIWFPTGGGKTEAYLALTALTIIARRRNSSDIISGFNGERGAKYTYGVSVIMRYTLRLLTSQQFERASFLICALDFLRAKQGELKLGTQRISIGLWIGKSSTPNVVAEIKDRNGKYAKYLNEAEATSNPFPVAYCPWCGKVLKHNQDHGYEGGYLGCLNTSCHFYRRNKLPIYYIDEIIYKERPTLLFATVDKFAQLYTEYASNMLRAGNHKSPDLIIQDELHLISGPLGSTVGLFESIVEEMASKDGHRPKIVASTATTRNTGMLIKSLYGKEREVSVFPAQGLSYKDNYFSHLENEALRCHVGIMPTGWTTSNETEIRLTATLLLSRVKLAIKLLSDAGIDVTNKDEVIKYLRKNNNNEIREELDTFWSIVLYYNSLKDLGRSSSRVSQEVYENLRAKIPYFQIPQSLTFLFEDFDNRKKEFTSREDSSRIKKLLTDAESSAQIIDKDNGYVKISGETMDLVFASNMISVGIDIARWNLMVMMGQPRSTSEYIQSSSRVARSHRGLVYNLINPQRNREFSLFENYTSFHAAYYKYVEPLSATPLNSQMLRLPIWLNIMDCYKQYLCTRPNDEDEVVNGLMEILKRRFEMDETMAESLNNRLRDVYERKDAQEEEMSSLRDIDPNCYSMIDGINY